MPEFLEPVTKLVLLVDSSYLRIGRDLLDAVSISSEIGKTGIIWMLWFRSGKNVIREAIMYKDDLSFQT